MISPPAIARMDLRREIRLSDEQWERVRPLLPAPARTGRPRASDRQTVEAILYIFLTGCRWHDLPREYGSHVTAWRRLRRWGGEGVWDRIWRALLSEMDEEQRLDWDAAHLDGSSAPAKRGVRRSVGPAMGRGRSRDSSWTSTARQ